MFKCKITEQNLTYGPWEPDELELFVIPAELNDRGYRRVSNAYCKIARIDRDDWLDVLAKVMHCSRADFYDRKGLGVMSQWKDHYIRCYSNDVLTVSPKIFQKIEAYR